jgi:hypothetical protein
VVVPASTRKVFVSQVDGGAKLPANAPLSCAWKSASSPFAASLSPTKAASASRACSGELVFHWALSASPPHAVTTTMSPSQRRMSSPLGRSAVHPEKRRRSIPGYGLRAYREA